MTRTALYIRHTAQPGKREEVLKIWEKYARDYIESAEGLLVYIYGFDENDPDTIVAYQLYDEELGKDAFTSQPWYPDYEKETAALLAAPSEFRVITPRWVKGTARD